MSHTTVNIPDPSISLNSNTGVITASGTWTKGFTTDNSYSNTYNLSVQTATTITPTESSQTAVAAGKYTTGAVTVAAISSTYVGSGIATRSAADITSKTSSTLYQVTIPAGYYAEGLTQNRPTATLAAPSLSIANSTGVITATASTTSDYYATQNQNNTLTLTTQAGKTITPTESTQTAVASYR